MKGNFKPEDPLSAVFDWIDMNRPDVATGPYTLMTTFPRKVYQHGSTVSHLPHPVDNLEGG